MNKISVSRSLFTSCAAAAFLMVNAANAATIPTSITVSPDPIGIGWNFQCIQSVFGQCVLYGVEPDFSHTVAVELADGSINVFNAVAFGATVQLSAPFDGTLFFTLQSGVGALAALDSTEFAYLLSGELLDLNFNVLDPAQFRYTLDGIDYDLPSNPVPLPAALPLLAGGLGCLGLMGWWRRPARLTLRGIRQVGWCGVLDCATNLCPATA